MSSEVSEFDRGAAHGFALRREAERSLALLAWWFITGHEPTADELRGALARAGLETPDALIAALAIGLAEHPVFDPERG